MGTYAVQTGLAQPVIRPKSGVQKKNTAAEGIKNSQKLLLTWLVEQPQLYRQISKYISPKDFTEGLYEKVADRLFEELEHGIDQVRELNERAKIQVSIASSIHDFCEESGFRFLRLLPRRQNLPASRPH